MIPRIRAEVFSAITTKLPRLERSGGISVRSTHLPTA
jgi:hypothetical protein